jgi:glucoamylase
VTAFLSGDQSLASTNEGFMMPEQVWADSGKGTLSATPLAWTHAQFVRLAWSIDAGRPVEQPSIVACRYAKECGS